MIFLKSRFCTVSSVSSLCNNVHAIRLRTSNVSATFTSPVIVRYVLPPDDDSVSIRYDPDLLYTIIIRISTTIDTINIFYIVINNIPRVGRYHNKTVFFGYAVTMYTSRRMEAFRKTGDARLQTFASMPSKCPITKERLARAGFVYLGTDLTAFHVQCAFCGLVLGDWKYGMDPLVIHRTANPRCKYFEILEEQNRKKNLNWRIGTFKECPPTLFKSSAFKISLAKAGFFYQQNAAADDDTVTCAWCSVEMRNWNPYDIPFDVHCRTVPRCPFVVNPPSYASSGTQVERRRPLMPIINKRLLQPPPPPSAFPSYKTMTTTVLYGKCKKGSCMEDTEATADDLVCSVCLVNSRKIAFIPCGHFVSCISCSTKLGTCCLCMKKISATLRTFV